VSMVLLDRTEVEEEGIPFLLLLLLLEGGQRRER